MTSLLKPAAQALQPLEWRARPSHAAAQPARDPVIDELEGKVRELEGALTVAEVGAKDAVQRAHAEGSEEAKIEFERDEAKRIAAIEAGLATAVETFRARLELVDDLALLLCETALDNVFARPRDFQDLVSRAIERQIAEIHRDTVLRIRVSASDFSDEALLDALQARSNGAVIIRDKDLAAGDCRIELRLGEIELSVARYWEELRQRLFSLAREDAGA